MNIDRFKRKYRTVRRLELLTVRKRRLIRTLVFLIISIGYGLLSNMFKSYSIVLLGLYLAFTHFYINHIRYDSK